MSRLQNILEVATGRSIRYGVSREASTNAPWPLAEKSDRQALEKSVP